MILEMFKIAILEIKKNKIRNIFFLLFSFIALFIGHIIVNFAYNVDKYINELVNTDLMGRTLFVIDMDKDYKEIINDVMTYDNVVYAYNTQDAYLFASTSLEKNNKELNVDIEIKPLTNYYKPTIVKGRIPTNGNEIVCPIYLKTPDATMKNELIEMSKYLDKEITISYKKLLFVDHETLDTVKTFHKDVTVVGLFTNAVSFDSYAECYMLEDYLKLMAEESKIEYSEKFIEEATITENGVGTRVIVDKAENVEKVVEKLTNNGYSVTLGYNINFANINTFKTVCWCWLGVLFSILLVIIIIYIKNLIKKEQDNIGLFKVFGYKNNYISNIILFQILILLLISYIISLLFTYIGIIIINNILSNNLNFAFFHLNISFLNESIYMLFIFSLIMVVSYIVSSKIYKIEIRNILNENNN